MRILIVDDDAVMRNILSTILRLENNDVDVAENGLIGVEMWENGTYDVVLMDVQMPYMNGLDATRSIREREQIRGGHTPIVAVTAYALKKDEAECLACGMDAFISKPIDFKECLEVIRSFASQ